MAKKETKKAAKAIISEPKKIETMTIIETPQSKPESETKPVNPNLTCNNKECGYTIGLKDNEALIGVACWHCKGGKMMN